MPGSELFADVVGRREAPAARRGLWARRAILTVALAIPILALLNLFGQQPTDKRASAAAATMTLSAPSVLRGGLLFQSRIEIVAHRTIDHLRLQMDDGWFEGIQLNSIEPEPTNQESRNGRVVLSYGRLRAGDRLIVWVQAQVDPTNPGRRPAGVTLEDSLTPIARIDRTLTVLP